MSFEKIIRLPDGSRARIFAPGVYRGKLSVTVTHCLKGKRTFNNLHDPDCHLYRVMSLEEREVFREKLAIKLLSTRCLEVFLDDYNESTNIHRKNLEF